MNIKLLNKEENSIEIIIEGEGHTLSNLLRNVLFEDESVEFAGYSIDHPIDTPPKFYIRTNGTKSPIQALIDASEKIANIIDLFLNEFKEAMSEE